MTAREHTKPPGWVQILFLLALLGTGVYLYRGVTCVEEIDELKYITLAEKLDFSPSSYTLRGSYLMRIVARDVNDVPLFYHPPLVPVLLKVVRWVEPDNPRQIARYPLRRDRKYALVPVIAHLLTVLVLWSYWGRGRSLAERAWPALLLLLSPIAGYIATQVWLDTVLTLFFVLALSAYHRALRRGTLGAFALAGVVLGLALLTKFSAVLLLPVILLMHFLSLGVGRSSWARLGVAAAAATALSGPWFALFYHTYGSLLPTWIKPSAEMMKFNFVRQMVNRDPLFYLEILALHMPLLLLAPAALLRRFRQRETWLVLGMAALVIAAFTYAGLMRSGYQTRHILPALPFLCLAAGWVLARLPRWSVAIALLGLAWGVYNLHMNLYVARAAGLAEVGIYLPWREGPETLLPDPATLQ